MANRVTPGLAADCGRDPTANIPELCSVPSFIPRARASFPPHTRAKNLRNVCNWGAVGEPGHSVATPAVTGHWRGRGADMARANGIFFCLVARAWRLSCDPCHPRARSGRARGGGAKAPTWAQLVDTCNNLCVVQKCAHLVAFCHILSHLVCVRRPVSLHLVACCKESSPMTKSPHLVTSHLVTTYDAFCVDLGFAAHHVACCDKNAVVLPSLLGTHYNLWHLVVGTKTQHNLSQHELVALCGRRKKKRNTTCHNMWLHFLTGARKAPHLVTSCGASFFFSCLPLRILWYTPVRIAGQHDPITASQAGKQRTLSGGQGAVGHD
eukprot:gene3389-biopygen6697